ncbi:RagB/SusD family nutrient uptake outer membrane protein, partial [Riemerella anatipestifer]|nr:RagB/SusD family nutrient uptake outer membrane protein [Riemerella anatipestifer]
MKRFLIYTSLLGVFLMAESCRDSYLETVPTGDISAESITQTADNMMLSINGMHRSMYTRQNNHQGQSG